MKTGLRSHSRPVKKLAPRSCLSIRLRTYAMPKTNTYINRADKEFKSHHPLGKHRSKNDSKDPRSDETFHCLLWREFNQLSSSKRYSAHIGKDVVDNDQACRQ